MTNKRRRARSGGDRRDEGRETGLLTALPAKLSYINNKPGQVTGTEICYEEFSQFNHKIRLTIFGVSRALLAAAVFYSEE